MKKILFLCLISLSLHAQTDNTTWTFLNGRFCQVGNNLSDLSNASTARTNLGISATLAVTGALTSSGTAGIGYAAGSGGTVTQATSKSTGVTLNKIGGAITTHNAALAAAAEVKFTVTNSTVTATDVPMVAIKSGGTSGSYLISVSAVATGSFDITISNASAGSLSEALVISFGIFKISTN